MVGRSLIAALTLALPVAATVPVPVTPATFLAWPPAARAVRAEGLVATDVGTPCPPDDPNAGQQPDDCTRAVAVIETAGRPSFRLAATVGGSLARLGIGPLERGRGPGVILTTFTGGAHCCEHYDVALPDRRGWRRLTMTRNEITAQGSRRQADFNYGLAHFPTDLDGDGRADFVLGDDAFAYAFTDYADSWTPPVVLTIAGDGFADVSRRPGFRRLFEADLAKARRACVAPDPQRSPNGACAAYVADAARLGRFAAAWREVLAHYDHGQDGPGAYPRCTARYVRGKCPHGHLASYRNYPAALHAFLVRTGYVAR